MDELQHLRQAVTILQAERNLFERLYFEERQRCAHLQKLRSEQSVQADADQTDSLLSALCRLTLKQRASILALLAGHSYAEIASVMGVSTGTIKLHCKPAFDAMGCHGLVYLKSQRPRIVRQLSSVDLSELCGVPLDWMVTQPQSLMRQLVKARNSAPPPPGRRRATSPARDLDGAAS